MQPPGNFTDKSWHSQCKNCLTTPPVPAEERGLPGAQPGFPTPQWEGELLLQLCHKGGLVNHTSMNSLLWAVPGRLSPHPTTTGTAELIKVWNGITITHTHKALDSSAWSKYSGHSAPYTFLLWNRTQQCTMAYFQELNILLNLAYLKKKKSNHNSSTLFYKPCTNKRQFSPCPQNYVTRAWYFTQEFRKEKKPKQQNNPTNSRGESSINWRESLGKTQFNYQRIVLLIAELEPAAVLAAHFSCLVTYIQNTLWFSTVKRFWLWQTQKIPFLALEFH